MLVLLALWGKLESLLSITNGGIPLKFPFYFSSTAAVQNVYYWNNTTFNLHTHSQGYYKIYTIR